MIVTGFFFADSARAANNKLNVTGGVLDYAVSSRIGSTRMLMVQSVILVQRGPDDDPTDMKSVTVTVQTPEGNEAPAGSIAYGFQPGVENGFLCLPVQFLAPVEGRYIFRAAVEGSEFPLATGLRVIAAKR